jgi:hypothetical protein
MMSRQDNPPTHPNFDAPIEVVADPSLSKQEKAEALEDLEQDARQLAIASGEGMSGGEPTALAEVLHAKEALEQSGEGQLACSRLGRNVISSAMQ